LKCDLSRILKGEKKSTDQTQGLVFIKNIWGVQGLGGARSRKKKKIWDIYSSREPDVSNTVRKTHNSLG